MTEGRTRTAVFMIPYQGKAQLDVLDGYLRGFLDGYSSEFDDRTNITTIGNSGKMWNTDKGWETALKKKGILGGKKVIKDIREAMNNHPASKRPFILVTANYKSNFEERGWTDRAVGLYDEAFDIFENFIKEAEMLIPPRPDDD